MIGMLDPTNVTALVYAHDGGPRPSEANPGANLIDPTTGDPFGTRTRPGRHRVVDTRELAGRPRAPRWLTGTTKAGIRYRAKFWGWRTDLGLFVPCYRTEQPIPREA